jgi:hypothetical protein
MSELMLELVPGRQNIALDEVAHVMVPGRNRENAGYALSVEGLARPAEVFQAYPNLADGDGNVVCSGYKSPRDRESRLWYPGQDEYTVNATEADTVEPVYFGIPEAVMGRHVLLNSGLPADRVKTELNSTTTPANFARAERLGYFSSNPAGSTDERPVLIIAQAAHLERILDKVAPKTLKREYLGLVVPEIDHTDPDSRLHRLSSWFTLAGISPDTRNIVRAVDRRSRIVWSVVNLALDARALLTRQAA